jgi:peptidoglycan L-alanyl-D-glutamate endopeptidase CwlK
MALTPRDLQRLHGVHGDLVAVVRRAFQIWATKNTGCTLQVSEGLRTQRELYAKGRTTPGPVVTQTMASRHLTGHAVDLVVVRDGAVPWNDIAMWDLLGDVMLEAAQFIVVPIRWGADWDRDGKRRERGESDSPHFELPRANYPD